MIGVLSLILIFLFFKQCKNYCLPQLPTVPGDEGVGEIVEVGSKVCRVKCGDRVILSSRMLGTWRYYGIYNERHVHIISRNLPLPEASMLSIAPCMAYRLLKDFRSLKPGDSVVQNAANSPCGQSVIQLCKAWGINTYNIVASNENYENVKKHLISIGACNILTMEEAIELSCCNTSFARPALALNCLDGVHEDVVLRLLKCNGTVVYYGCAYHRPFTKAFLRNDVNFCKFNLNEWEAKSNSIEKDEMLREIITLMALGNFKVPAIYEPIELKDYIHALRQTADCEAFSNTSYIFDLTLPP